MIPISVNGGTLTQTEIDMLQERAAQHITYGLRTCEKRNRYRNVQ